MTLFALTKTQESGGQIALAAVLAVVGVYFLLPRPRGRHVGGGIAALVAAAAVFTVWVYRTFGHPLPDIVGTALFWLFSAGALIFGTVLVVQRNPARGAIAFAFVVLSTCGLFLLLAAPFLMAATIIIYAGAIVVTFLFMLMLSRADSPSDENDRSREPLYGGFAGFAFVGLVLFTLHQTTQATAPTEPEVAKPTLPVQVLTPEERKTLADVVARLDEAEKLLDRDLKLNAEQNQRLDFLEAIKNDLVKIVGVSSQERSGSIQHGSLVLRLELSPAKPGAKEDLYRADPQARDALAQARRVREANFTTSDLEAKLRPDDPTKTDIPAVKAQAKKLRDEVVILHGVGQLPARNVANLGFVLYSEHLLAIELAGTLLLVAVIGAVAISHRKGVAK